MFAWSFQLDKETQITSVIHICAHASNGLFIAKNNCVFTYQYLFVFVFILGKKL